MIKAYWNIIYMYCFITLLVIFWLDIIPIGNYYDLLIILLAFLFFPFYHYFYDNKEKLKKKDSLYYKTLWFFILSFILLVYTTWFISSILYLIFFLFFIFWNVTFYSSVSFWLTYLLLYVLFWILWENTQSNMFEMSLTLIFLWFAIYFYNNFMKWISKINTSIEHFSRINKDSVFYFYYFAWFVLILLNLYFDFWSSIFIVFSLYFIWFNILKKMFLSEYKNEFTKTKIILNKKNIIQISLFYYSLFIVIITPLISNSNIINKTSFIYYVLWVSTVFFIFFLIYNSNTIKDSIKKNRQSTLLVISILSILFFLYYFLINIQNGTIYIDEEVPFEFNVVDETWVEENLKEIDDFLQEIDLSEK